MRAYIVLALVLLALVLEVNSASLSRHISAHLRLRRQQKQQNSQNAPKDAVLHPKVVAVLPPKVADLPQKVPDLPVLDDYNPFLPDQNGKTNTQTTCVTASIFHCHGCFYENGQCCCPTVIVYDD